MAKLKYDRDDLQLWTTRTPTTRAATELDLQDIELLERVSHKLRTAKPRPLPSRDSIASAVLIVVAGALFTFCLIIALAAPWLTTLIYGGL